MKNKKFRQVIIWIALPVVGVALNFNFILFNCNIRKTIKPDFTVEDVFVTDLDYLFDESNPINLVDIMDLGNLCVIDGLKVLLKPDKYCFVTAKLQISNNTGKDIYDEDWCVKFDKSSFYAVSVNQADSPLFSPILNSEKGVKGISFIAPKDSAESDDIRPVPFSVKLRVADLRNDWNYDEFYGK